MQPSQHTSVTVLMGSLWRLRKGTSHLTSRAYRHRGHGTVCSLNGRQHGDHGYLTHGRAAFGNRPSNQIPRARCKSNKIDQTLPRDIAESASSLLRP